MPKVSRSAIDERAKCEAPPAEFVAFAKGLVTARSGRRLRALAEGPVAELFARRLIKEALSGAPHAATCITLIARLGKNRAWAGKLRKEDALGHLPSVEALQPKELDSVGRGLLVLSQRQALSWIARAYLHVRANTAPAKALEKLLLDAASTTRALARALDEALATQPRGQPVADATVRRSVGLIEKHARRLATRKHRAQRSPLRQLAKSATPPEAARLLSALLLALAEGEATDSSRPDAAAAEGRLPATNGGATSTSAPKQAPTAVTSAIAEAAWSDADEALGRALQDMDLLVRCFDRLESVAKGELADPARRARSAANLVLQWVQQAARYRRVSVLNKPGDRVPFDPAVHELDGQAGIGDLVRIVKPAVVRGSQPQQVVLLRGEAEPD